jgi:hypothetical protein
MESDIRSAWLFTCPTTGKIVVSQQNGGGWVGVEEPPPGAIPVSDSE